MPPSRRRFDLRHFPVERELAWAGVWPTAINRMQVAGRRDPWSVPFPCIHFVTGEGLRFYSRGGTDVVLGPDDVFLIEPEVPFCYHETGVELVSLFALRLWGPAADGFVRALGFGPDRLHFRAADPAGVKRVMLELMRIAQRTDRAAMHEAVAALHKLPPLHGGGIAELDHDPDDLAEAVLRHLREHLEFGENVEQLAQRFGVSRSTLFLRFRERFGRSPAQLLIETRLARAKLLLETTALEAAEIARLCGYHRPEHFHRQFREQTGGTPLEWRRGAGPPGD